MAATTDGVSTTSVSMGAVRALTATVSSTSSTEATLYRVTEVDMAEVSGQSTVTVSVTVLTPTIQLAPTVAAQSDVAVSVARQAHRTVEAGCTSSVSVSMSAVRALSATAAGSGSINVTIEHVSGTPVVVGKYAREHARGYAIVKKAEERGFAAEHARAAALVRRKGG